LEIPDDCELVSGDFDSLYSNIILEDALNLICDFIRDKHKSVHINIFAFREILKIVFEFNIFKYKLPKYSEYYKRLQLENLDYKDLFKKYDDKNVFFYCDPPYRNYESFYTNHNFTDESHIELCSNLKNLKSSWILSYYEFPEMKEWYKDYKMVSKKHNLGTEYLILNNNI
jgi:site-specific DNA-adenine methylase